MRSARFSAGGVTVRLLVGLLLADGLGPGLLGHRLARLDQPHRGGREQCGSAHLRARPVADRGEGRSTVAVDLQLAGSMMIESVGCAFHDPHDGNTDATAQCGSCGATIAALDACLGPASCATPDARPAKSVRGNERGAWCAHRTDAHQARRALGNGTCAFESRARPDSSAQRRRRAAASRASRMSLSRSTGQGRR